jgi:hypothetical protein
VASLSAVILATLLLASSRPPQTLTYKNKPLEAWFHGSRTNFYSERTRQAAQEAIDSFGMNAFPFLLAKLKTAQGNGLVYFKVYRALPPWVQSRLPYPISGDDIKAMALDHIYKMRSMSREQVQAFAECVPSLRNPRLRMRGFEYMLMKHQTHPAFLELCRKLLNDQHPGIQLKAAIYLGQSGLAADPREPRLFPMLVAALDDKEKRKASVDLSEYWYQQQPPGSAPTPRLAGLPQSPFVVPPDQALVHEISTALERLRHYLTQAEKDRLNRATRTAR